MKHWLGLGCMALAWGCSAVDDAGAPLDSPTDNPELAAADESSAAPALPQPAVRRAAARELSPDQLQRQREVDRFIAQQYRDHRIVDTVETYSGDVIDYVDPATVPGSQIEPPPRPSDAELAVPPGVQLQRSEVDEHPELRGPAGTIAMVRPRFDTYLTGESGAKSLTEHIERLSQHQRAIERTSEPAPSRMEAGQPAGLNRLYGGYIAYRTHINVIGWVNEFGGAIESGTFSLMETATMCPGANMATDLEMVGATVSRDRVSFGDSTPRLRVEFFTRGTGASGNNVGGWDGAVSGFVPAAGRPYGPNATLKVSTIDGVQYESRFEIRLSGGNWWVSHNGNWLGYYPGNLFNLINKSSCQAHWYGEVYDPTPASWTSTNMGSGRFASEGYGKAAYYRDPFYVDTAGVAHWPENVGATGPIDSHCYSTSAIFTAAAPWERSFYLGGPGGEAAGCD